MNTLNLTVIDERLLELFNENATDTSDATEDVSHRLLDGVTYTFCISGILLNFFAHGILQRKCTIGVLLIKLILLSDGLVCVFYLLNQIWTDITLTYFLSALVTEYLLRKPVMTYVSNIFRILAVAAVGVSNWYMVIMIIHRCISIYASPLRSRTDRSLWACIQKKDVLWVAFVACWVCSLLNTVLLLSRQPLILEVMIFMVPLTLVFLFSIVLQVKLRSIQKLEETPARLSCLCCLAKATPKSESDDTFTQTKMKTSPLGEQIAEDSGVGNDAPDRVMKGLPQRKISGRTSTEVRAGGRRKTYYRITMTVFSLALSFLVLDSLQFLDLLIRIPWRNILGSVTSLNGSLTQSNATDISQLWLEIEGSSRKQSVLSIVKNTCTLGKTLTNFLILCAHSRYFRNMVAYQMKRTSRLLRILRYRMRLRRRRSVGEHRIRHFPLHPFRATPQIAGSRRGLRCCSMYQDKGIQCDEFPSVNQCEPTRAPHKGLFGHKTPNDEEGYVVHKLRYTTRQFKRSQSKNLGALNGPPSPFQSQTVYRLTSNENQTQQSGESLAD